MLLVLLQAGHLTCKGFINKRCPFFSGSFNSCSPMSINVNFCLTFLAQDVIYTRPLAVLLAGESSRAMLASASLLFYGDYLLFSM